jgi:HK97 family phage prohead protease
MARAFFLYLKMEIRMQTKSHKLSFKNLSEDGCFEGYASVFNIVDHQKELVLPGAFHKSLDKGQHLKMLWQHDMQTPIGVWESVFEDNYGLYVKGRLLMDLPKGKEAYTLLKGGVIDGLSIGFIPVKSHFDETKQSRFISEVDLVEISLVTFAANPKARVTSVKNNNWDDMGLSSLKEKLLTLKDYFLKSQFLESFI